ncbi:hypothetical protein FACS1894106_3700 [Spirochaetia bacterium]|nr:hypothetical protein FACS1894106_3700 [Spirochaetia bacterium]
MKNSKVILGMLAMALAFGFVLAGCAVGEYEHESVNFAGNFTEVIKLESGGTATYTSTFVTAYPVEYPSETITMSGTYKVSGTLITITWTSCSTNGVAVKGTFSRTAIYRLKDGQLETVSSGYTKKSVASEDTVIAVEFAEDFDFSVFEAK